MSAHASQALSTSTVPIRKTCPRDLLADSLRGANWPGSEKARYREKGGNWGGMIQNWYVESWQSLNWLLVCGTTGLPSRILELCLYFLAINLIIFVPFPVLSTCSKLSKWRLSALSTVQNKRYRAFSLPGQFAPGSELVRERKGCESASNFGSDGWAYSIAFFLFLSCTLVWFT